MEITPPTRPQYPEELPEGRATIGSVVNRQGTQHDVERTIVEPGVFQTRLGDSEVPPSRTIDAYAPAADQLPGLYDWTPGNLEGAAQTIVSIADRPNAPLRPYVGHGLDDVRRHYQQRLDDWAATEHLTRGTL